MAAKGNATTHSSKTNGHGQKVSRSRFAIPMRGLVRGLPVQNKIAPWYLKHWGSKPVQYVAQTLAMVA